MILLLEVVLGTAVVQFIYILQSHSTMKITYAWKYILKAY